MTLAELTTAAQLAAERTTLKTLSGDSSVAVEITKASRTVMKVDALTGVEMIAARVAAIEAQLAGLGIKL